MFDKEKSLTRRRIVKIDDEEEKEKEKEEKEAWPVGTWCHTKTTDRRDVIITWSRTTIRWRNSNAVRESHNMTHFLGLSRCCGAVC